MLSWQLQFSPLPDTANNTLRGHALTCPVLPCPATLLDDGKHGNIIRGGVYMELATPKCLLLHT